MIRKFTDGFLDHAESLVSNGSTMKDAAVFLGCHPDNLSQAIRARNPFFKVPRGGRPAHNRRDDLPEFEIVSLYQSGESELAIAQKFNISRPVIGRVLTKNRVRRRDRSVANFVRMSRMTPKDRKALAKSAHEAVRGKPRKNHAQYQLNRAASIEAGRAKGRIGPGEIEIAKALADRGHDVVRQRALKTYNIDVCFGSVAVEVKFGTTGRMDHFRNRGRTEEILNSGLKPAFVHIKDGIAIDDAMDEIISLLELIDRKPSTGREYWMVRSGLQKSPITRHNGHNLPRVEAPPELVTSIRKVDYR